VENGRLGITGVLLTGGESRRMGRNKALLEIDGKKLIEKNLEVLDNICDEVLISSREEGVYAEYGYKVVPDVMKGKGPLGGLYSVLQQALYPHLFLVACDMPLLNVTAIRYLYREMDSFDALVPEAFGRKHPLHAFYHKRILSLVSEKLQNDKLKLIDILNQLNTKYVMIEENCREPNIRKAIEQSLINVNTPEEWKTLVNSIKGETKDSGIRN
jgi:molybdopterin-guanine dinucleotide biosynthesis protein A